MRKLRVSDKNLIEDPKEALAVILSLCMQSTQYTRRTSHIHEVAMQAMGYTLNQRVERHERAKEQSRILQELTETHGSMSKAKAAFKDYVTGEQAVDKIY